MSALGALLVERIRRDGPITFRAFMAQALYHPEHGYYTTGRPWQGRGDFTTAPRYGEAFAFALARFCGRVKDLLGPGRFEVVEVGAGSGVLAGQLHKLLEPAGMRLRVVEHRRPPTLPAGVPWSASVRGLAVRGVIVSNELFDALPVHRVRRGPAGLEEQFVAEEAGRLVARWGPPSRPALRAYLGRFGMLEEMEEGQVVEVGLDALAMLRELAGGMERGVVLTIDYGHTAPELLARGPDGTLAAYRDHRLAEPLEEPGLQDLTAHVNLTALEAEGPELGLSTVGRVPQWEFLAANGALGGILARLQDPRTVAQALAEKTLVAPGRMGEFQVLVQGRELEPAEVARLHRALRAPAR